ncbi:hypothetical protein CPB83DRAFT_894092 [Crepidotus variabilis]|uniref:Uncharacterized protein n=1 Tax=Crepidotus variabilis TaxID=179855 RepID=A0A9P6EGX6_9AGAR|nr:hypothetical protein CPB83DRAFT_894092 [Crepidotus variabilis]
MGITKREGGIDRMVGCQGPGGGPPISPCLVTGTGQASVRAVSIPHDLAVALPHRTAPAYIQRFKYFLPLSAILFSAPFTSSIMTSTSSYHIITYHFSSSCLILTRTFIHTYPYPIPISLIPDSSHPRSQTLVLSLSFFISSYLITSSHTNTHHSLSSHISHTTLNHQQRKKFQVLSNIVHIFIPPHTVLSAPKIDAFKSSFIISLSTVVNNISSSTNKHEAHSTSTAYQRVYI